ncbi:hypothetical protein ABZ635_07215 [Nocardiopsis sp. NPDC007018]|uniref:hypothetical protein n=1 Tax=Nocardiopsis sp. NPDC007018 TaxID=3155721 RepID=UPI0033C8B708
MYEPEPTPEELYELAALADLEAAEIVQTHSPRFWDADTAEVAFCDPYDHPSWDVREALTEAGWDDPADAALLLEQTVQTDYRLVGLVDTPTGRPHVRPVNEALLEEPDGEEALHERVLALVPSTRPADQIRAEVRAA